jgi:hypothetical protein
MIDIANVPEEAESLIASLLAPEYQIEGYAHRREALERLGLES